MDLQVAISSQSYDSLLWKALASIWINSIGILCGNLEIKVYRKKTFNLYRYLIGVPIR